jgi:hypothetical protein
MGADLSKTDQTAAAAAKNQVWICGKRIKQQQQPD